MKSALHIYWCKDEIIRNIVYRETLSNQISFKTVLCIYIRFLISVGIVSCLNIPKNYFIRTFCLSPSTKNANNSCL